ncbi:MAG: hypothetical protein MZV64_43065 [Ignavibacteriales bacterium]|nr:hypothetical protein [Ignavibacteriales bacterium]
MIADAPQQHAVVVARVRPEPPLGLRAGLAALRVVVLGRAVGQHRRAVVAHPHEVVRGERQVPRIGPAEQIAGVAGLLQDLHEAPAVAEGIDVEGHPRPDAELLARSSAGRSVTCRTNDSPDGRLQSGCRYHPPMTCQRPARTSVRIRSKSAGSCSSTHW